MPEPLRWDMTLPDGQPLRWDMGPEFTWDGNIPASLISNSQNTMSLPKVDVPFPVQKSKDISDGLKSVAALFPVLSPVGPSDREGLQSIAAGREPYVAEAFTDAQGNPGTVPGTVDMASWALLEEHHAALDKAESEILGLLELVQGIKAVTGDHRYRNTRKYYDYLGGNLDALPGAQGIHAKIAALFARQGARSAAKKNATPPPTP